MKMIPPHRSVSVSLPKGLFAYSHAILRDGSLSTIALDQDIHAAWRRDPAGAGKLFAKAKASFIITDGATNMLGPELPSDVPFPIHDRFPDGRWLVVLSRTDNKPNGLILAPDGQLLRSIMLGDGIEHVKIDDVGRIWVGWFDEGIYGKSNWKWPGREWPVSSEGLACFDDTGGLLWTESEGAEMAGLKSLTIDDCYALNVSGQEVWASPYSDFPLLRGEVSRPSRVWKTNLSGPRALGVRYPFIVAAGSYKKDKYEVVVMRLDGKEAQPVQRCALSIQPDSPTAPICLDGRGDQIHLVQNGEWHMWRVADFV
jgi:hypothetical protein